MSVTVNELQDHWAYIGHLLTIRNEREYDQAIARLNDLLDEFGTDEQHPLYEFLDTLGAVIHAYEEEHFPMPAPPLPGPNSGNEDLLAWMKNQGLIREPSAAEKRLAAEWDELPEEEKQAHKQLMDNLPPGPMLSDIIIENRRWVISDHLSTQDTPT